MATATRVGAPLVRPSSGRSLGWWGTVAMIATEGMLFALLLFGNFYLRVQAEKWPLGDIPEPELIKSGIRSVVLLASSAPMHVAEKAIKRGDRPLMLWGLAIAWLMGAAFLAGHVEEYLSLWSEYRPGTNAYGSVFYTITGFHALHLVVGLLTTAFLFLRGLAGHYGAHDHDAVENGVLYWHFVDVVWLFVYSSLYLSVAWL